MGSIFKSKKPPAPDYSHIRRQQAEQKARLAKREAEVKAERDQAKAANEARRRTRGSRSRGRALLAFAETGLRGVRDKLGG